MMTPALARDATATDALARSAVYTLLARAFRYPASGAAAALAAVAPGEALALPVAATVDALAAAAAATDDDALAAAYVATFGHVVVAECPLYETACGIADPFQQAQALADVTGFYQAFGVTVAPSATERADHLVVELEFMHYLAYREAYAIEHHGGESATMLRQAQARFLELHLGRWAPVVARAVAARADGVLGAAAALLERFLEDECARAGVTPARLLNPIPLNAVAAEDDGTDDGGEEPWS